MSHATYNARIQALRSERNALRRNCKLLDAAEQDQSNGISSTQRALMMEQLHAMSIYIGVLNRRINVLAEEHQEPAPAVVRVPVPGKLPHSSYGKLYFALDKAGTLGLVGAKARPNILKRYRFELTSDEVSDNELDGLPVEVVEEDSKHG